MVEDDVVVEDVELVEEVDDVVVEVVVVLEVVDVVVVGTYVDMRSIALITASPLPYLSTYSVID